MSFESHRRGFLRSMAATSISGGLSAALIHAENSVPFGASSLFSSGSSYINPRNVLLWECTRKEIRERLASGTLHAAIIPTGSTEQHNEHMAMIMDSAAALLVSQQAALQLWPRVIVTTPVTIGISPHWMNRRGTLSLRTETFLAVVRDICESLKAHGIEIILIVNGHGGNIKALNASIPVLRDELGITIENCSYWDSISPEKRKDFVESGNVPMHASEFETSIALAAFPERIRYRGVDHDAAKLTLNDRDRAWDKATYEESKLATAEKGERIIGHAVRWVAEKLEGMME